MKEELEDYGSQLSNDVKKFFIYRISLNKNIEYDLNNLVKNFDQIQHDYRPFIEPLSNYQCGYHNFDITLPEEEDEADQSTLANSIISFFTKKEEPKKQSKQEYIFVRQFL